MVANLDLSLQEIEFPPPDAGAPVFPQHSKTVVVLRVLAGAIRQGSNSHRFAMHGARLSPHRIVLCGPRLSVVLRRVLGPVWLSMCGYHGPGQPQTSTTDVIPAVRVGGWRNKLRTITMHTAAVRL